MFNDNTPRNEPFSWAALGTHYFSSIKTESMGYSENRRLKIGALLFLLFDLINKLIHMNKFAKKITMFHQNSHLLLRFCRIIRNSFLPPTLN